MADRVLTQIETARTEPHLGPYCSPGAGSQTVNVCVVPVEKAEDRMYCRNCKNEVAEIAVLCMACGCPPKAGSKFCFQCAADTNPHAEICVKCGVSLRPVSNQSGQKNQVTAVLLAVFLGYWSWLYSFKTSKRKFFIGLGCSIPALISMMLGIVLLNSHSQVDQDIGPVFILAGAVINTGIWIWAVVDNAIRPALLCFEYPDYGVRK